MSKDILEEIIAHKRIEIAEQHKRIEIAEQEKAVSAAFLEKQIEGSRPARSLKQSLLASPTGIIAEFKRRSPSKGWIKQDADAARIPAGYEQAGAAALSILTDERFFGGSLRDIRTARPTVSLPILRKDFIISPYQLLQAKAVPFAPAHRSIASRRGENLRERHLQSRNRPSAPPSRIPRIPHRRSLHEDTCPGRGLAALYC